jgi:23S rRNA pseudouridine1911/1915/1917 synthase
MSSTSELLIIDHGVQRLDRFLAVQFPHVSRSLLQRWIAEGYVLVNGESVKKRYRPEPGDEVEVQFMATPEMELTPEPMALDILYEDSYLLVVNKPPGLVVHPGAGNPSGTLVHGLLHHCLELPGDAARPGLVHRLDKDTSGALVVAKSASAHMLLTRQFAQRAVEKTYLGLCWGTPSPTSCEEPLGRDPRHRQRMAVVPEGKEARTTWKVLRADEGVSLLEILLHTGRTHQIRVHLSWVGTPLVGDPLYGGHRRSTSLPHQWLHAWRLAFDHPVSGQRLQFQAPLPTILVDHSPPNIQRLLRDCKL